MTLIALASAKGSPGATTAAVLLAAAWPTSAVLLVEADPDGGDLAARYGLAPEPGLVTAAAAVRRGEMLADLRAHTQISPGGIEVVAAPAAADQSTAALGAARHLADAMRGLADTTVLADCGRMRTESPARPILDAAEFVVIVTRAGIDDLHHVAHLTRSVDEHRARLLVVGEDPYRPEEIAEVLEIPLLGALADDRTAAEAVRLGRGSPRVLGRSSLARAASEVAHRMAAMTLADESAGSTA